MASPIRTARWPVTASVGIVAVGTLDDEVWGLEVVRASASIASRLDEQLREQE